MEPKSAPIQENSWKIEKIGVIGPGIVGMPMASMLANARIKIGTDQPAKVIVIQRNSDNSGWKVDAINSGRSVIGGIEPDLDAITNAGVKAGVLSASSDFSVLSDADVILVSVQTDKKTFEPDYGPMFGALEKLGEALKNKPASKIPLVIFESTLAPTTMDTLFREHFKKYGLEEGKDILLGNSPNRVMPGRLVERIRESDKLAGGLHPETPKLISRLYKHIVTNGEIFQTNSLTAEIVKTLENAYRDVRIAFSTEIVRYCDLHNIDFYKVRDKVNTMLHQSDKATTDPNAVPSGGLLIPMLGVGGHCLPKDGILLWWRNIQKGNDTSSSLILASRLINDESPSYTFLQAEKTFGNLRDKKIALLGVAYRFNSEDTRNSPTLTLANYLRDNGVNYIMHDPYVKTDDQNLLKYKQTDHFTGDIKKALDGADYVFMCTAHKEYIDNFEQVISAKSVKGVVDACNIYHLKQFSNKSIKYTGIGRGQEEPKADFTEFVFKSFQSMERGLAIELLNLINFYNTNYAYDEYNKVKFADVQRLAKTCSTGCEIADTGKIESVPVYNGFSSSLVQKAFLLSKSFSG
ncbi:MAG TPA: nucleotide sugar dehydrogenase [Chitinophagaceae bacterium]|nr:nucleotide sugar dehydrogenase [Chitinophagaceae bacterium]